MKYMKIQMKCKYVHFNKKYHCFIVLAEVEHTIPCLFNQCRSVWKSLQPKFIQTVLFHLLKLLEFFGNVTAGARFTSLSILVNALPHSGACASY